MTSIQDISTIDQLADFASDLAADLNKTTTIYLYGDLGAGKTTFVQYFLKTLGYEEHVPSPSYAIVNSYAVNNKVIIHADLYRLSQIDELDYLGWDILTEQADIILVEWPEMLPNDADIKLFFKEKGSVRSVTVDKF